MTARGKPGKPKAGFPPFPPSLESPQNQRPSHIPTASTNGPYIKTTKQGRPNGRAQNHQFGGWAKINCRSGPKSVAKANALYLEVVRLAYNVVTAFQRTCLPKEWQGLTLSKLRHRLLWLPGELTRPQNRPILRFANWPLIQKRADEVLHHVHGLKPLEG